MDKTAKVTIRKKAANDKGERFVYLDFYPAIPHPKKAGKTTRFRALGMFVYERANTEARRTHNKNTMLAAEQIRNKVQDELYKAHIYTPLEKQELEKQERANTPFLPFAERIMSKNSVGKSAFVHLQTCFPDGFAFGEVHAAAETFREYLLERATRKNESNFDKATPIGQNTAHGYLKRFLHVCKQAYTVQLIERVPTVKSIPLLQKKFDYLTKEEVGQLLATPPPSEAIRLGVLVELQTGLRISDVCDLQWQHIHDTPEGSYFDKVIIKTRRRLKAPIARELRTKLGERKAATDSVVAGYKHTSNTLTLIQRWAKKAGIDKHVTSHTFRRTFGVWHIAAGTTIYEVSMLLGHGSVKQTEQYLQVPPELAANTNKRFEDYFSV